MGLGWNTGRLPLMRYLPLILFLLARVASAATGDIVAASTANNSGSNFLNSAANINLYISGYNTNSLWNTGFQPNTNDLLSCTNLDPSKAQIVVTLTSKGFDSSGNATTYPRTIYGTIPVRYPYPGNAFKFNYVSGGNLVVPFWLSDCVYDGDSGLKVNVLANTYSNNNAVSALTVTNASTQHYPNIIAQWSYPGDEAVVSTWTNHFIGFQAYAMNQQPLAYACSIAQDAHGHTNIVQATLVRDFNSKGNPIIEYQATHSTASFTQGDIITNKLVLKPWIGTNQMDTTTIPSGALDWTNHYVLCDKNNALKVYVWISPTGSDTDGRASLDETTARSTPVATLPGALYFLSTTNQAVNGRNNASACFIDCEAGTYLINTPRFGWYTHSGDDSWCTIRPGPGVSPSSVIFTNSGGLDATPDTQFLKLQNVTLNMVNDYVMFYANDSVWLDHCYLTNYAEGNPPGYFYNCGHTYLTSCVVSNAHCGVYFGSDSQRGCFFDNAFRMGGGGCQVGNVFLSNPSDASDFWGFQTDNWVVENCSFFRMGRLAIGSGNPGPQYGMAWVQNVFEKTGGSAQPIIEAAASEATGDTATNMILALNDVIADRGNMYYFGMGATPNIDTGIVFQGNIFGATNGALAIKTDVFQTGGVGNGAQVGNWTILNGVSVSGQWMGAPVASSSLEFYGVTSLHLTNVNGSVPEGYVLDASQNGTGAGKGNYHLKSSSPILKMFGTWNGLPWDIEGNNRGAFDPPGAYATANPRRGGLMICN